MKTTDAEIGDRVRPEGGVVPQAVQEANALRERRQAAQETAETAEAGPPAKSAKKDEWVAYAGSLGLETEGKSIPELQEAVEAHEAENA